MLRHLAEPTFITIIFTYTPLRHLRSAIITIIIFTHYYAIDTFSLPLTLSLRCHYYYCHYYATLFTLSPPPFSLSLLPLRLHSFSYIAIQLVYADGWLMFSYFMLSIIADAHITLILLHFIAMMPLLTISSLLRHLSLSLLRYYYCHWCHTLPLLLIITPFRIVYAIIISLSFSHWCHHLLRPFSFSYYLEPLLLSSLIVITYAIFIIIAITAFHCYAIITLITITRLRHCFSLLITCHYYHYAY